MRILEWFRTVLALRKEIRRKHYFKAIVLPNFIAKLFKIKGKRL